MEEIEIENFFDKQKERFIAEAELATFTRIQAEFLYEKVKAGVLTGGSAFF